MVGMDVNCVMVFNDASSTWSQWDDPWFLGQTYGDMKLASWATAPGTSRQLIITQNMFPSSENNDPNWLAEGADGDFDGYATTLATNLVNAGLGNAVIRLGHEANGTWYPDSIPDTTAGDAEWVQFWDNIVTAMRSVPGASFKFDWCVNIGYRNIPLADWYPGNDYVDIIGMDVYDDGTTQTTARWQHFLTEGMGVQTVEQFAAENNKPLSIPEWGINPSIDTGEEGGGDDAGFVQGIADLVANNDVAYQSYFFQSTEAMQLTNSPQSLAAYSQAFDPGGPASGTGTGAASSLTTMAWSTPPALTLTGGPQYGSTVGTSVTYTFAAQSGYTPECSLDGGAFAPCTSSTSDVLSNLSPGFHWWAVDVMDGNEEETQIAEDFVVS